MTSQFNILSCSGDHDVRKQIVSGLNSFNETNIPFVIPEKFIQLDLVVKDEKDEVAGGVLSMLGYWGGLDINILWVREDLRGKGVGAELLRRVEEEAKTKGAVISLVNTFDFQAKEFYLKNGYTIVAEHKNFPGDHSRYYFEKRF